MVENAVVFVRWWSYA